MLKNRDGKTFRERLAEDRRARQAMLDGDRRLRILQVISEDAGYAHNEILIRKALLLAGHELTKHEIREQLEWLDERGLVTYELLAVAIVRITALGVEAARGEREIDGVAVPLPE